METDPAPLPQILPRDVPTNPHDVWQIGCAVGSDAEGGLASWYQPLSWNVVWAVDNPPPPPRHIACSIPTLLEVGQIVERLWHAKSRVHAFSLPLAIPFPTPRQLKPEARYNEHPLIPFQATLDNPCTGQQQIKHRTNAPIPDTYK